MVSFNHACSAQSVLRGCYPLHLANALVVKIFKYGLTFCIPYRTGPMYDLDIITSFLEAVELQGILITYRHHLPRGGEG